MVIALCIIINKMKNKQDTMFKTLSIKNYKVVKDLKLDNFKQINFFVGENNIGKTTLLNAIYDKTQSNFNTIYLRNYTFLNNIRGKKMKKFLKILQKFIPTITDITNMRGNICITDSNFKDIVYLNNYGNGFIKVFNILSAILLQNNQIILIDEIENSLHIKYQDELWKSVLSLLEEYKIQLFITTHSYEIIDNLFQVAKAKKKQNESSLFHLKKDKNGKIIVVKYSEEDLEYALRCMSKDRDNDFR